MIEAKNLLLPICIPLLILSGCSSYIADDGCYEESFIYNEDLGVCEKKGWDWGQCDTIPLINRLSDCERSNSARIPEGDIFKFCDERSKEIDTNTYQYNELVNNIKNICLHNFAIATRDDSLCGDISYESKKEICINDVRNFS